MFTGSNNVITWVFFLVTAALTVALIVLGAHPVLAAAIGVLGLTLSLSPRIVKDWERGILLRLGVFRKVISPGISWVFPGIDILTSKVDMRIRSTSFSAEKTLTQDTVPVNVDAVMFWVVTEAQRTILEIADYEKTVSWAAQTTLRDVIGKSELVRMISDRQALDEELQTIIDAKTSDWGVTVQSVEIRDVRIPPSLEDAMSRKAQADREKEARVILAESELKVAEQMEKASEVSVSIPFWGPIHVAGRLEELNSRLLDQLSRLWHFDPWWLLTAKRFHDVAAVPLLTRTNYVDLFSKRVSDAFYRRRLERLVWVSVRGTEGMTVKPYRPEMLPHREQSTPAPRANRRAGWVLSPFWAEP